MIHKVYKFPARRHEAEEQEIDSERKLELDAAIQRHPSSYAVGKVPVKREIQVVPAPEPDISKE